MTVIVIRPVKQLTLSLLVSYCKMPLSFANKILGEMGGIKVFMSRGNVTDGRFRACAEQIFQMCCIQRTSSLEREMH